MNDQKIAELAALLDDARLQRKEVKSLTAAENPLTIEEAYKIQDVLLGLRLKKGEKLIGYKMGLTSRAKMDQMNIYTPIFGFIVDSMRRTNSFDLSRSIHPKIEPEIAFVMKKDLPATTDPEEALDACAEVAPALEI